MAKASPKPGCAFCIQGVTPAGIHPIVGALIRPCQRCLGTCPGCKGRGAFLVDFDCDLCVRNLVGPMGKGILMCRVCLGFVDLIPLHSWHEAVIPHEH